jgi:tagatose kinase
MAEIWTMGELLVEIMRPKAGMQLYDAGEFLGPYPSGAPVIFIDGVAQLGHSSGIIGGVGKDDFGACITDRLREHDVDVNHVLQDEKGTSAVAFITYFEDGSRKFIYHVDGTPAVLNTFPEQKMKDEFESGGQSGDVPKFFHVMGCSLMANPDFREEIFKAVRFFHEKGARISFDPNIRPELLGGQKLSDVVEPVLSRCSVLLPGFSEMLLLTGMEGDGSVDSNSESAWRRPAEMLIENPTLEYIVLKLGKKGAKVITRDDAVDVAPFSVKEVDPTGAGDYFDAGFLCGLIEGKSPKESARLGAAAGAINATAFGPAEGRITPEAVAAFMNP